MSFDENRTSAASHEALDPRYPAELVPPDVLATTRPRRSDRLPYAMSTIEEGLSLNDPDLVVLAASTINRNLEFPSASARRSKAIIWSGALSMFEARAARRDLDSFDVQDAMGTFYDAFSEYRVVLEMTDERIRDTLGGDQYGDVQGIRNAVEGSAAEAVVIYLGLDAHRTEKGVPFYPSSLREEAPAGRANELFGINKHDVHTYNPTNPYDRALLSVKGVKSSQIKGERPDQESIVKLVDLKKLAAEAAGEASSISLRQVETKERMEMPQILLLLEQCEYPDHSDERQFALEFRDVLSRKIQEVAAGTYEG